MKKGRKATPIRDALRETSRLRALVRDGLGAMKGEHRARLDTALGRDSADSLDVDEALREKHPQDNRWNYLLGHEPTRHLVGVESHAAREDQIGNVIQKRKAALDQLREHLKDGVTVHSWLWLSSGDVQFADTEKARRRLDQAGFSS